MKQIGSILCIIKNFINPNIGGNPTLTERINGVVLDSETREHDTYTETLSYTIDIITNLEEYIITGKTSGIIRKFNKNEIKDTEKIYIGFPKQ